MSPTPLLNRLALGTAQFGMSYGIANKRGRITDDEALGILRHARSCGMDTLDTAAAYGESEALLGRLGISESDWRVVTKLPSLPPGVADTAVWADRVVRESLKRLRIPHLYGLLLHRDADLTGREGPHLYGVLRALKEEGKVEKIGVSIYDPEVLPSLIPHFDLDLIQAPLNVLDRRFITTGWLDRLHEREIECHVRSVFLQGLLLMGQSERPAPFARWTSLWDAWDKWLLDGGLTPLQACLAFALADTRISKVVVGVDNLKQLEEILLATDTQAGEFPDDLSVSDVDLINPSHWSTL